MTTTTRTLPAKTLAGLMALVVLTPVTARAVEPHLVASPIDAAGSYRKPAVAVHPGTRAALHAWQGRDVGAGVSNREIFTTLVPTHPVPAAPTTVRRLSYMGGGGAFDPTVVALGDRFLAAWSGKQDGVDNANRIYLRTLSLSGVTTSDPLRVSTAALAPDGLPADDSRPQIACSASHASCLVVWSRRRGTQAHLTEVHGRHVDLITGTLGPEFQISRAGSAQVPMGRAARAQVAHVAAIGGYVVAWTGWVGETGGGNHAYLAEVAPGSVLPGPPRAVPMPAHHGRVGADLALAALPGDPRLALAIGFGDDTGRRGLMIAWLRMLGGLPVLDGHYFAVQGMPLIEGPRAVMASDGSIMASWGEGERVDRIARLRWWSSNSPHSVATVANASELDPDLHFVNGPAMSTIDGERVWLAWAAETGNEAGPQSRILGLALHPDRLFTTGFESAETLNP